MSGVHPNSQGGDALHMFNQFSQMSVGLGDNRPASHSKPAPAYQESKPYVATVTQPEKPYSESGWTLAEIDSRVEIRAIPGRGRCLFAKVDIEPGEIVFVEKPSFVAIRSFFPELFDHYTRIHAQTPLSMPPVWHFAALCCITRLPRRVMDVCLHTWVPDDAREITDETRNIFEELPGGYTRGVDMADYEQILKAWRFNSFGHHTEEDGLVLYDRVSMMSHSCQPSCGWHYGQEDTFVLRARSQLYKGDEISISYIGLEDVFKSTEQRREKLVGWMFDCQCQKCSAPVDTQRGVRCQTCGVGTIYFKTLLPCDTPCYDARQLDKVAHRAAEDAEGKKVGYAAVCPALPKANVPCYDVPASILGMQKLSSTSSPHAVQMGLGAMPCGVCGLALEADLAEYMLDLEKQYVERLTQCSAEDVADLQAVWAEADKVFSADHWVAFELQTMLKDAAVAEQDWLAALDLQRQRVGYMQRSSEGRATYSLAWGLQEIGDLTVKACGQQAWDALENEVGNQTAALVRWVNPFRRKAVVRAYEDAHGLLTILCGSDHEFTKAIRRKWQKVLATMTLTG